MLITVKRILIILEIFYRAQGFNGTAQNALIPTDLIISAKHLVAYEFYTIYNNCYIPHKVQLSLGLN